MINWKPILDEIEKAHPDVMNIFLGVFDEGRITDNRGRLIDCSNALFVLTSNFGAGEVDFRTAETEHLVGFDLLWRRRASTRLRFRRTDKRGFAR